MRTVGHRTKSTTQPIVDNFSRNKGNQFVDASTSGQKGWNIYVDWSVDALPYALRKIGHPRNPCNAHEADDIAPVDWTKSGLPFKSYDGFWFDSNFVLDWSSRGLPLVQNESFNKYTKNTTEDRLFKMALAGIMNWVEEGMPQVFVNVSFGSDTDIKQQQQIQKRQNALKNGTNKSPNQNKQIVAEEDLDMVNLNNKLEQMSKQTPYNKYKNNHDVEVDSKFRLQYNTNLKTRHEVAKAIRGNSNNDRKKNLKIFFENNTKKIKQIQSRQHKKDITKARIAGADLKDFMLEKVDRPWIEGGVI
jgi:hypothetical protein